MIPSFQYYFPNVIDGINQKHLNSTLSSNIKDALNKIQKNKIQKNETETENKSQKNVTENKSQKNVTENETEMMIDDKYLGKIIGRGGRTLDQIRTASNTKITIYRQLYNNKRRVVIVGNQDNIQKAKTNILELCY